MARAASSLVLHLRELVHAGAGALEGVVRRPALGNDGWFVNDRLFALVSRQARIVVKVPDAATQKELLALGAEPWRIGKKAPMAAWLQLPEVMHDDETALDGCLERSWSLVRAAPAPKPRKR